MTITRQDLGDAATRAIEAECRVPDGYVLVPMEPTEPMLEAALHAGMQHLIDCINDPARADEVGSEEMCRLTYRSRYKSMLAAAPKPAEPGHTEQHLEMVGPNVPFPGMQEEFEAYYSQSFTDRDWRREAGVWAAAWKSAIRHTKKAEPVEPVDLNPTTFLRLIETVKYLVGIAERGEGRKIADDETPEQFVLGYVKRLEKAEPVAQEPASFYIYKEVAPRLGIPNVLADALPWVYDQDPSSGFTARLKVYLAPPDQSAEVERLRDELAEAEANYARMIRKHEAANKCTGQWIDKYDALNLDSGVKVASQEVRIAELEATIEAQRTLYRNASKIANENDELMRQRDGLVGALEEAREEVVGWAAYASEYFQQKHNLKGYVEKLDATLASVKEK